MVTGTVRLLLRIEGAAIFVFAVALYLVHGGSPWLLVPLLLAVDVSMIGYLSGPGLGAVTYNVFHHWLPGFAVLGLGLFDGNDAIVVAGAVLVGHVGMDRMAGYGLKYPTSFADTHLGHIGKSR